MVRQTQPRRGLGSKRECMRSDGKPKLAYPDRESATEAMHETKRAGNVEPGCRLNAYRCRICERYHVGRAGR
jgi:hypothetical protein